MVERLEQLRSDREDELGHPVKLVLLLDEVSLFIGTDFDRLTELQTLAESVDETGDGDIQLVATAQAKIEDVQPQFAARGPTSASSRIGSRTGSVFRVGTSAKYRPNGCSKDGKRKRGHGTRPRTNC